MLQYTQPPEWIKRTQALADGLIAFETITCDRVLPDSISSEQLFCGEVFEVDLITAGSGYCQVFGQTIPCKQGDIFVIPSDIPHNCFAAGEDAPMEYIRLMFDVQDWFDREAANPGNARFCYGVFYGSAVIAYATLNSGAYRQVMHILQDIFQEVSQKSNHWRDAVRAGLSLLFITLSRYIGKAEHTISPWNKEWHCAGVAVRMVMENYFDSELRLEDLANSLYISKSQFSRSFKEFTGESFSDYLRGVRMHQACRLLRETDMTVEQVANACGMRDTRTFVKNFKNFTGKTPNQYKENKKAIIAKGEKIMVILSDISEKLQQGRAKIVAQLVQQALDEGCDPEKILNEGLLSGMDVVGEKFRNNEIFVPEVLVAARAMNMGAQILKPHLGAQGVTNTGKVCIGTVHGDLHDIGKNLVKMMLEGKGLEVVDLGTDVPAQAFIDAAIEQNCQVICCSALLTTTMPVMEDVVKAAQAAGIRDKVKIMIGGAPVTESFCQKIGADAYTDDAASAANVALAFCQQ